MECGRRNTQTAFFVTQVSELMKKPDQEQTVQLAEQRTIAREVAGSNPATYYRWHLIMTMNKVLSL